MDDRLARLEAAVSALRDELAELHGRLDRVEKEAARPAGNATAASTVSSDPASLVDLSPGTIQQWLALTGRTLVILGGAYLLRALTEAHLVPARTGVALGLAYGAPWLLLASRAGTRGAQSDAFCHGLATALIGFPLVWEATFRFNVLSPAQSAGLLGVLAAGALVLAAATRLQTLAWIVTFGALASACSLAIATAVWPPYAALVVALGLGCLWLAYAREWIALPWPAAVVANMMLFIVTGRAAAGGDVPAALLVQGFMLAGYLGSFGIRTLVRQHSIGTFEVAQTVGVLAFAYGGALYLLHETGTRLEPIGAVSIIVGAGVYGLAFGIFGRRHQDPNVFFYSLLGLVLATAGAMVSVGVAAGSLVCGALGVAAAIVATRRAPLVFAVHAVIYVAVAAAASGLLTAATLAMTIPTARWPAFDPFMGAALVAAAIVAAVTVRTPAASPVARVPRTVLFWMCLWVFTGVATYAAAEVFSGARGIDAAVLSTLRTSILVAATLSCAAAARTDLLREMGWLTYPLLVATGLKILFADFPGGRPATLFVALALYGIALLGTARGKPRVAVSQRA